MWPGMWVTSCTGSVGWDLRKSQLVEFLDWKKMVDFRGRTCWGADRKVSIERWYLSPYVKKPLNSKVIKSFILELRSHKCFCVLGFLCYIYMCVMDIMNVLCTDMNISISCIHIHGYVTNNLHQSINLY